MSDDLIEFTPATPDLDKEERRLELELREEKAESQKRMAWVAMISMIVFTVFLFLPFFSDERINAIGDVLGLFFVAQAGIVGAYFGFTSWMSRK
jgi:hypothetical protein